MNQQAFTHRKIHIYRCESQTMKPLPAKIITHTNRTTISKAMSIRNDGAKPSSLIWPLTSLHLLPTFSRL